MSKSSEPFRRRRMPRQEAQPRTWDQLTEDQQQVVRDIHEWVLSFLDQKFRASKDTQSTPFEWSIDLERTSNVILIDGGRGSGKTSVMLSILRLWNELLGRDDKRQEDWKPLAPVLKDLNGRIITVPTLDLEPLPTSTSLLPWIAERIKKLGEGIEATGSPSTNAQDKRGEWHPEYAQEPRWKKAWRALIQDAAAGWTERTAHLGGMLDAEAFATELAEENRARLSLLEHWREFVDEVLASAKSRFESLFKDDVRLVISIDDADMNPLRCVELVRLLRVLWHPRVIFMLTGHSDLFLKTLRLQLEGVFRQLLHGSANLDREAARDDDQPPSAKTLAFQMYDKIIPPSHRFSLSSLSTQQRLRLLEEVLKVPIQQQSETGGPSTLREYFNFNPYVRPILPERLRKIQDFRQAALTATESGASAIAYALWEDALQDEINQLPTAQIPKVEQMVALIRGKLYLRGLDYAFQRPTRRTTHFQLRGESSLLKFSEAVGIVYVLSVGDQGAHIMPERLNAALLLAADLAFEERDGQFDVSSFMPTGRVNGLVQNDLVYLAFREATPGGLILNPPSTTWLLPDWKLALNFALFDTHWNDALHRRTEPEKRPAFMAAAFLCGVLAASQRTLDSKVPVNAEGPDWAAITRTLAEKTDSLERKTQRSEHDDALLEWLKSRALLLAAPESGLPAPDANQLLSAWLAALEQFPPGLQKRVLAAVRAERHGQITKLNTRGMQAEEFLRNVDAHFTEHLWRNSIESRTESDRSLFKLLDREFSEFHIHHKFHDTLREPDTLLEYATRLGAGVQVTPALAEEIKVKLQKLRGVSNATPHVLIQIWHLLTAQQGLRSDSHPQDLQYNTTEDLAVVNLPKELEDQLILFRSKRTGVRERRSLDALDAELRFYSLQTPPLPDSLEQFLIFAHDVIRDETDPPLPWLDGKPNETWFASPPHAGITIRHKKKDVSFGWPTPRWPAFIDWAQEEKQLESITERVIEVLGSSPDRSYAQRQLEAFAHAILEICWTTSERRLQEVTLQPKGELRTWLSYGIRARDIWDPPPPRPGTNVKPKKGNRWAAFNVWAKLAVPLYALPELGLAPRFAQGLLGGWTRQLNWDHADGDVQRYNGPGALEIRLLRRDWARKALLESGIANTEGEVTRFLRRIDEENPQHPWLTVFGADSSTSPK